MTVEQQKYQLENDSECEKRVQQLEAWNNTIAHNLRGGVSNIKMLAAILTEKKITKQQLRKSSDFFSTSDGLKYIHDSSTSILETLNDLMEIAQVHFGEKLPFENCNIEEIVQKTIDQLQSIILQKSAKINLHLDVPVIWYPRAYMQSILYNLINNALKYSKKDGPVNITITTANSHGKTLLIVKDNGIGIDLSKHGNQMFMLNKTFHKGYESKGFGLYITRCQVESLGGSIHVRSVVNLGSEFTVEF